jgi:hypothetical protein
MPSARSGPLGAQPDGRCRPTAAAAYLSRAADAALDAVRTADEAEKGVVEQRQRTVLEERYDLSDRPIPRVMMAGGRKPVQGGVHVKRFCRKFPEWQAALGRPSLVYAASE